MKHFWSKWVKNEKLTGEIPSISTFSSKFVELTGVFPVNPLSESLSWVAGLLGCWVAKC
jgi:hypothetical protein